MRRLKVLVADDHALMVEAIGIALQEEPDLEIVGVAESGSQILPLLRSTHAEILLLDLRMPGIDGLTCLKLVRKRFPHVIVVVLSGIDSDEAVRAALENGARAFISKHIDPHELPGAILGAVREPITEPIGRRHSGADLAVQDVGLTERELSVLRALGSGRSNKQIAGELWLAEQTVKFHLTNIYRKLGVTSRTEAVHWAYAHGLLETPLVATAPTA
jgi:DNA-binding NarL/FixJ family response regulator